MARSNGGGFWADFRKFIMRGNVIDLAVAVVIGGAFGKIITSLVEDIITPVILNPALQAANVDELQNLSAGGVKYGVFLAAILNFLVIAFCIFLIIRAFEKAQRRFFRSGEAAEAAEAAPPDPAIIAQERLTGALDRLATTIETRNLG
jgi:large conductance mechanosensitive channel